MESPCLKCGREGMSKIVCSKHCKELKKYQNFLSKIWDESSLTEIDTFDPSHLLCNPEASALACPESDRFVHIEE